MPSQRKNETREEFLARVRDAKRRRYAEDQDYRNKRLAQCKTYYDTKGRYKYIEEKYGMTADEYDTQAKAQQHLCLVCGEAQPPDRPLVVDHCHKEGHVRGLLCRDCNVGLGFFKDNPETLRSAAIYLTPNTFECGAGI